MEQEVISITGFEGMITNPHKEDIPPNRSMYALNIDPEAEKGVLRGIEEKGASYTANSVAIPDVTESAWIKYEAAGVEKWDLVYIDLDDSDLAAVADFYAAEASRTLTAIVTPAVAPVCAKTFNEAVQIGMGNAAGTNYTPLSVFRVLVAKDFFDDNEQVPIGIKYEEAICRNAGYVTAGGIYPVSLAESASGDGYFQEGILYNWAVTIVYDGIQESTIILPALASGDRKGFGLVIATTGGSDYVNVTIRAYNAVTSFSSFDKRITAIKLYRAESSSGELADLGLYRLVKTIDIDEDGTSVDLTAWTANGNHYEITYTDRGRYEEGGTYEENTGMPESLDYSYIHYKINEVGGGYHWVANGYVPGSEKGTDWSRYIFRSKRYRPNMFNWAEEFLALPEIPKALAWYNDKLYAFSNNTVYRINPELLIVEDTFYGMGAGHRQSVLVTEFGMFFCNLNGAYLLNDEGLRVISDEISEEPRIEQSGSWKSHASASYNNAYGRITIRYESDKRLVLFIGNFANGTSNALGYYLPTRQWFIYTLSALTLASDSGAFGGKDGEVYISNATATYRLFAGTARESAGWCSKEFHLGEPSQNKDWNKIIWDAYTPSGVVAVKYNYEGGSPIGAGSTATSGAWVNIYKKTLQVYVTTTLNAVVDSLDIVVRRLFGKR